MMERRTHLARSCEGCTQIQQTGQTTSNKMRTGLVKIEMPHKTPAMRVPEGLRLRRLRSVARKAKSNSRPARKGSQRVSMGEWREKVPKNAATIPGRMPSCKRLDSKGRRPIWRAKQKTLQAQATCSAVWPVPKARRIKEYRKGYTGATWA